MSTNLTSQKVKDSFGQLLHIDGGPEATPKTVYSGTGTATALKVGTANIEVDGLRLDGTTISTTTTDTDLTLAPNGAGAVVIPKVSFPDAAQARTALGLGTAALDATGDFATAAQGALADTAVQPAEVGTLAAQDADDVNITGGSITDVVFTGSFEGITSITSESFKATTDLGYTTGAGGTVTQLTSKATPVTINKLSGRVTTHNAQLNRDTTVNFVVNNSLVTEDDVVIACVHSGATLGVYELDVDAVANGSFTLALRNHEASSDYSEAVAINFVVIKGAMA